MIYEVASLFLANLDTSVDLSHTVHAGAVAYTVTSELKKSQKHYLIMYLTQFVSIQYQYPRDEYIAATNIGCVR